jgi:hypothetical protein
MDEVSKAIAAVPDNESTDKSWVTAKDKATKLAHKNLLILQIAESLGDVREVRWA